MAVTAKNLLEFLEHELVIDTTDVREETLLFSTGIVDSFGVISLITYLEVEGGIRIDPADINLDNMDSIERILHYLSRCEIEEENSL